MKLAILLALLRASSAECDSRTHLECRAFNSRVKPSPCRDRSPGKLCGGLAQQCAASLVHCSGHCSKFLRPCLESPQEHHHEPWQLLCAQAQGLLAYQ